MTEVFRSEGAALTVIGGEGYAVRSMPASGLGLSKSQAHVRQTVKRFILPFRVGIQAFLQHEGLSGVGLLDAVSYLTYGRLPVVLVGVLEVCCVTTGCQAYPNSLPTGRRRHGSSTDRGGLSIT